MQCTDWCSNSAVELGGQHVAGRPPNGAARGLPTVERCQRGAGNNRVRRKVFQGAFDLTLILVQVAGFGLPIRNILDKSRIA